MSDSIRWVLKALAAWPRTTLAVAMLSIIPAFALGLRSHATTVQFAMLLVAQMTGLAWIKVMFTLMAYPLIYHAPFPSSFVRVSFVTQILFVISMALQILSLPPEIEGEAPIEILLAMLVPAYVLASLFFGGFLHLSYQFQRGRRMPWRRLDDGGAPDPLGLSG